MAKFHISADSYATLLSAYEDFCDDEYDTPGKHQVLIGALCQMGVRVLDTSAAAVESERILGEYADQFAVMG